jgi:long-chain fatty acid transport protein
MKRGKTDLPGLQCHLSSPDRKAGLLVASGVLLFFTSSYAEGFRNPPAGAFNLGRAGGRIAQVDDSSAAAQNPANLVDLSGTELQLAPSIVYINAEYNSQSGQSAQSQDSWKILPNAFAGVPLSDGQFALGLAVTMPYGLDSRWDDGSSSTFARPFGAWRYQSPFSTELTTVNVSPAVAAKLGDFARVGAGLDVMWSQVKFKQFYPWFLVTGNLADPDGQIRAEGDGVGVGGNFGLTLEISKRQRLAVTLRMPLRVDYSGDFQVDNVPAVLGGGSLKSDFSTSVKFPTIVAAGYGIELTDTVRVEADVEWLQFSNFKTLPLNTSNPLPGLPNSVTENWKDTFTAGIAGDWRFASDWTLRLGYQFYQSPVPDATFSPAIPDADQNVLTLGVAYNHGHHTLEAAYGADFYHSRHITNNQNPAFNGDYDITVHLFSVSYHYSF